MIRFSDFYKTIMVQENVRSPCQTLRKIQRLCYFEFDQLRLKFDQLRLTFDQLRSNFDQLWLSFDQLLLWLLFLPMGNWPAPLFWWVVWKSAIFLQRQHFLNSDSDLNKSSVIMALKSYLPFDPISSQVCPTNSKREKIASIAMLICIKTSSLHN